MEFERTHNAGGDAMKLTSYSDFAMRVLIYLKIRPDDRVTIRDIADAFRVSKPHLMKVVNELARLGYVDAARGRTGGLKLGKPPGKINLGQVIRATEPDFDIVECFGPDNHCPIVPACELRGLLAEARDAFLAVLDRHTLADLGQQPQQLLQLTLKSSG